MLVEKIENFCLTNRKTEKGNFKKSFREGFGACCNVIISIIENDKQKKENSEIGYDSLTGLGYVEASKEKSLDSNHIKSIQIEALHYLVKEAITIKYTLNQHQFEKPDVDLDKKEFEILIMNFLKSYR